MIENKLIKMATSMTLVSILMLTVFINTVGSLSITSVNSNTGPVTGGQEVSIYGDFSKGVQITQVKGGVYYNCALDSYGKAYCWGSGGEGKLGNGSTNGSSVPVAVDTTGVLNNKTLKQISVGWTHVCALDVNGRAYCWGHGNYGQLGNGSTTNSSVPVAVDMTGELSGKVLTQIAVGDDHTCVLTSDNQIYCWGFGQYGKLGNGSTSSSSVPVAVDTTGVLEDKTITQISAGYYHTCALDSDGLAYCWGYGMGGRLGNSSTINSSVPVAVYTAGVLSDKTITQIYAGGAHTCALISEGKAYCWGSGGFGGIGNGSTADKTVPSTVNMNGVLNGKTLTQISVGESHVCVLSSEGKAYCWGWSLYGRLGDGSTENGSVSLPVVVDMTGELNGEILTQINAAYSHTCAISSAGKVYCWGYNYYGQLGHNSTVDSSTPVHVHTESDDTGSRLPDSYISNFTVVFDINGTPAECINVIVAGNEKSLTCTTTAHAAGYVDTTVDDGFHKPVTLANGYRYYDVTPETSTASHLLKLNIYDTTSLTTMIETCDNIKADQEKNHTYTEETYKRLMTECEEGNSILDCLNNAAENSLDASECGDPDDGKDKIKDTINSLVPVDKVTPPTTGAGIWYVTVLGRTYAIPIATFVLLAITTLAGAFLAIFLVRKRINEKGIGGIKIAKPWSRDSYELVYGHELVKKHEGDPLTKIVDVSTIVRKYRIKFVLWHTVPVLSIVIAFIALILATASTMANSEYASIDLVTTGDSAVTIINIDKATSGTTLSAISNIKSINTSIHSGGAIDENGGVFAQYSPRPVEDQSFAKLFDNMTLVAKQTAPGGVQLGGASGIQLEQPDTSNPLGLVLIPSIFDSTTLEGQHTFNHTLTLNLTDIISIPNGAYNIDVIYTITVH